MQLKPFKKKIALLHFLPLELYPPVMNFINCWEKNDDGNGSLNVFTTPCAIKELAPYKPSAGAVKIKRYGFRITNAGLFIRLLHYFLYYFTTIFKLAVKRPDSVFYYDTISSFPAWCYKKFLNKSCRVFIHYHEYMSKEEYQHGMFLLKRFHKLEEHLYNTAAWVSHTNKERMQFFLADMPQVEIKNKHILPNYPPQSWKREKNKPILFPVRFIQAGSLGLETMYVKEFAEWIVQQNGKAIWDIYALHIEQAAMGYLTSLGCAHICFKGKANYDELPYILQQYDVGVILYKGHIPNYIYNAPNKLFEYYMCGLDVWFPEQMITAAQYATTGTFPRILPVRFEALSLCVPGEMVNRGGLQYRQYDYSAEKALTELLNKFGA